MKLSGCTGGDVSCRRIPAAVECDSGATERLAIAIANDAGDGAGIHCGHTLD